MAHLTVAASEETFRMLFAALRDNFKFEKSGSASFGPFSASYEMKAHLAGGTVDLRSDNTVQIKELDVKWDQLDLTLGVDLPAACFGGFCLIPSLTGGCAVRAPKLCVFDGNPDLSIPLHLDDVITTEVSVTGQLSAQYRVNPLRPAAMNDWDAQDAHPSLASHWQIFITPLLVDIDPIDIADTVGDLLENAINTAIDHRLGLLADWIRPLVHLGIDVVRSILDLPDDLQEWIADLFTINFGLLDSIAELVAESLASKYPLHQIEDPFPILRAAPDPNVAPPKTLVPVKVPIRNVRVFNNDVEMVLEANVG